jgi:competence protein ComGC
MRSLIGLLVVALIVALAYKLYFSKLQSQETGTPAQTISIVGVKNDLLAIAQAERAYQAEHGSYASLEELKSSGAMTMLKPGRDGYTYDVQTSSAGFRVVAHCPAATSPGCSNWAVDQSMEVSPAP